MNLLERAQDTLRGLGHKERDIERLRVAICPICKQEFTYVNNHRPLTCGATKCKMKGASKC